MVVVAEAHAGGGDFFCHLVELVGVPAPIVEGVGVVSVGVFGCGRVFEAGTGADEEGDADFLVEGDDLVEFFMKIV